MIRTGFPDRCVRCVLTCAAGLAALAALVWPAPAAAQGFTISAQSGLDTVRAVRAADWWLSGVGLIDLDGDGDLDVFLSSHGSYGALAAVNDGKGHFTVAAGTYPDTELLLPCDLDEDGKIDFAATYSDGGAKWWLNRSTPGGMLSFLGTMVTRDGGQARQQALVDIDGDGKLDWLRGAGAGVLFDLGDGKGGFAAASRTLANPGGEEIAVIPVDIDGDGDEDLLVNFGRYDTYGPNGASRLYRNDGGGTFTNVTTQAGLYEIGLAVKGVGDFDQDGDTDIIALEKLAFPHTIFLNDGKGNFTRKAGAVDGPTGTAEYGSWGLAAMTDLDNDGLPDIVVDGRNYLHVLRGTGGGSFSYVNKTWGGIVDIAEASVDNGFSFGDIDGDGDLDLIGYKTIDPRRDLNVYVNNLPAQNWINVRPVGVSGNKAAVGAQIRVYAAGGDQLLWFEEVVLYNKQVQQAYYARGETERHYGLGARASVDVTVTFSPSHKQVRQNGVAAGTTVRISEDGAGVVVPPPTPVADAGTPPTPGDGSGGAAGTGGGGSGGSGPGTGDMPATGAPGTSSGTGGSAARPPQATGTVTGGCALGASAHRPGAIAPLVGALALLGLAAPRPARRRRRR
ncbi:MAG TPA: VCBS repeat-containing protein [Polyangia bacterium]|nr:VCBS repeat-containing protein [Polyangia bacterium]